MSRVVPVTGTIDLPEGHTYADATWRYGTEVAGNFHVAGGAQPIKFIEVVAGSRKGELRTPSGEVFNAFVHDIGDFVPKPPFAVLEVRFRGLSVGFERYIPLVLTKEEVSLRIDKQMAKTRLVELTRDEAVFLNWRLDAENYVLVDGVHESIVALTPKDKFKGHKHTFEDIAGLNIALNNRALESSVASRLAAKADLVNGKIPTSQLPGAAITDIFFPSSDAAMLALDAQPGDIAVRTDKGGLRYELTGDPTNLDHWSPQFPAGADGSAATGVTSINTMRGDVILGYNDVGAAPKNHSHTAGQITDWNVEVDKRAQYNVVPAVEGGITATWDNTTRQQKLSVNGAHSGFYTALMTALLAGTGITITTDPVTGRPVVSVSGSGGWVAWNDIDGKPERYPPENHAARHRTGGPDALTPADIGAAPVQHSHTLQSLGAAAAQHQHAAADMPELAEFVRDTMGAALAGSGGITVTNNDAGDQIMISAAAIVGVTLEELDGAPSLAASKIIVPSGSLTQVSPGVVKLAVASGGGTGGTGEAGMYSPTYKRNATIINPHIYRSRVRGQATLRTAFAQPSGNDIRVFTTAGIERPTVVSGIIRGQNYLDHNVLWLDTLDGSEQRDYIIKYGDAYASERRMSESDAKYLNRATKQLGTKVYARNDPDHAFRTADFGQNFSRKGNPGDLTRHPLPNGATAEWQNKTITQWAVTGAGGSHYMSTIELYDSQNAQVGGFGIAKYYPMGIVGVKQTADSIVFETQIQYGSWTEWTLRYRAGVWNITISRTGGDIQDIVVYIDGQYWNVRTLGSLTEMRMVEDISSWLSIDIMPEDLAVATVGDETVITP